MRNKRAVLFNFCFSLVYGKVRGLYEKGYFTNQLHFYHKFLNIGIGIVQLTYYPKNKKWEKEESKSLFPDSTGI